MSIVPDAAKRYAESGLLIIPIERSGQPVTYWDRSCVPSATTIDACWITDPDLQIGLVLGSVSEVVALEVTIDELDRLTIVHDLPKSPTIIANGSRYHLLACPRGQHIPTISADDLGLPARIRGHSDVIPLPPSVTESGGEQVYWETGRSLEDVIPPPIPAWLTSCLTGRVDLAPTQLTGTLPVMTEVALHGMPRCLQMAAEHGLRNQGGDEFGLSMHREVRDHYGKLAASLLSVTVSQDEVEAILDHSLNKLYPFCGAEILAELDQNPRKWTCQNLNSAIKRGLDVWMGDSKCTSENCPHFQAKEGIVAVRALTDDLTNTQRKIFGDDRIEERDNLRAFEALYDNKYHCVLDLPSIHGEKYSWYGFDQATGVNFEAKHFIYYDYEQMIQVREQVHCDMAPTNEQIEQEQDEDAQDKLKSRQNFHLGLAKQLRKRTNHPRIESALKKHHLGLNVIRRTNDYDMKPLVNCAGVTLEWQNRRLSHRLTTRDDMASRTMACAPDPEMPIPHFTAFFERLHNHDPDLIRYARNCIGVAMKGQPRHQHVLIYQGRGGEGKTLFYRFLLELFGGESEPGKSYATDVSDETFLQMAAGKVRDDLAALQGIRLLLVDELENNPNRSSQLNVTLIKKIAGGGRIIARHLFAGVQTKYVVQMVPIFFLNSLPGISDATRGIWRKIRVIKLRNQISEEEKRDMEDVLAELRAEMPGILYYFVEGLKDDLENGTEIPESVRNASKEYQQNEDVLNEFLGEYYDQISATMTLFRTVYDDYLEWAGANKVKKPFGTKTIAKLLEELGFDKHRDRKGQTYRCGLQRKDPAATTLQFRELTSWEIALLEAFQPHGKREVSQSQLEEATSLSADDVAKLLVGLAEKGEVATNSDGNWVRTGE